MIVKPKKPRTLKLFAALPGTISLATLVLVVGIVSGAASNSLHPTIKQWVGFAPYHLPAGELLRIATSLFFTSDRYHWGISVFMILICVGWAEIKTGTGPALATFASVHMVTLAMESLIVVGILGVLKPDLSGLMAEASDVGPSAGYYGCLGLAIAVSGLRGRGGLAAFVWLILAMRIGISLSTDTFTSSIILSNLAHFIAFPLGWAIGLVPRKHRLPSAQPPKSQL